MAVLLQKCPQGLVLECLAWLGHLGEQRGGYWPAPSHAPHFYYLSCREGQFNREMLKPSWKADLLPGLEPHKSCTSGLRRDTFEAGLYPFPQPQR